MPALKACLRFNYDLFKWGEIVDTVKSEKHRKLFIKYYMKELFENLIITGKIFLR